MSVWASAAFVAIGMLSIFAETFVPAGGIVGVGGFVLIVIGVVTSYVYQGSTVGTIFLTASVIGTPALLILAFKVFPRTYVGRRLILSESQLQEKGYVSHADRYAALLGKEGIAVTPLRPVGTMKLGNDKFSVVTEGDMIEQGATVKVIAVEGSRVVVRRSPPADQKTA